MVSAVWNLCAAKRSTARFVARLLRRPVMHRLPAATGKVCWAKMRLVSSWRCRQSKLGRDDANSGGKRRPTSPRRFAWRSRLARRPKPPEIGLERRPSGGCRFRIARCGGVYENQSSYGVCLDPAVASFREFSVSRAEKFLGRHMERVVGRQGSHLDHDRPESGGKLRIPRRVHAGGEEQNHSEKSYLHQQWDHRYADKDRQGDGVGDVAQFAGRRDRRTDEAVESPPRVLSRLACMRASLDAPERAELIRPRGLTTPQNRSPYVLMEVETLGRARRPGWKVAHAAPAGLSRRREVDAAAPLSQAARSQHAGLRAGAELSALTPGVTADGSRLRKPQHKCRVRIVDPSAGRRRMTGRFFWPL